MSSARRYYEANVLVAPLGASAREVVSRVEREGTTGLAELELVAATSSAPASCRVRDVGSGWLEDTSDLDSLVAIADRSDVVVFLASDLDEVEPRVVPLVAGAARDAGSLVAAITIETASDGRGGASEGLARLRDQVDVLVTVRSTRFVASFLDVLRGGRRDTAQLAS